MSPDADRRLRFLTVFMPLDAPLKLRLHVDRVRGDVHCCLRAWQPHHRRGGRMRWRREAVRDQMRCLFSAHSSAAAINSWRWSTVSHCGFRHALAPHPTAGRAACGRTNSPRCRGFVSCKKMFFEKKKKRENENMRTGEANGEQKKNPQRNN